MSSQLIEKKSISDTAYNCGYKSESAFIYAFKSYFNITPKQFIKQYPS